MQHSERSDLFYSPWEGQPKHNALVPGCSLLVLGESHYQEAGLDYVNSPTFTVELLTRIAAAEQQVRFFTNLGQVLVSATSHYLAQSEVDANSIWKRVAFSNLIQHPVPTSATKPAAADWATVDKTLIELIARLTPNAVLIASQRAWNALATRFPSAWTSNPTAVSDIRAWGLDNATTVYATWCYHPSRMILTGDRRERAIEKVGGLIQLTSSSH